MGIMTLHINTPLFQSQALSSQLGRSVWLKMDALQPSGSFKLRGIGHACKTYAAQGATHFVSSSGGNAGLAVAYSGRALNIPVTVVVPESTPQMARDLLRQEQAKVIVHGESWQEANELALTMVGATDAFLHPFDDPLIWEGHATMVDEVHASGFKPDAVVLSVGGGGLLSGVVAGLQRNNWQDVAVVAVETEGASSYHQSVLAGKRVQLAAINSVAKSLGAKQVCAQSFALAATHPIMTALVSDYSAVSACKRFLTDHRVLVEPACGASLATVYDKAAVLSEFQNILIVVCGGATASLADIQHWLQVE